MSPWLVKSADLHLWLAYNRFDFHGFFLLLEFLQAS